MPTYNDNFNTLRKTVTTLRSNEGCPWDRRQDSESLKKYFEEECAELLEAIDKDSTEDICEEAGDLLFLLVLLSEIHSEKNAFTIEDVIKGVNKKMIRRHPHVFSGTTKGNEDFLKKQWEKIKSEENKNKQIDSSS